MGTARDKLLLCRSESEILRMRRYVRQHPNPDHTADGFFFNLSADCLRYIEALKEAGINPNNIDKVRIEK